MINPLLTLAPDNYYFILSVAERAAALALMISILPLMVRESMVRDELRLVRLSLLTIGVAYSFVILATGTYTYCLAQTCNTWFLNYRGEVALLNGLGMLLASTGLWLIYRKK